METLATVVADVSRLMRRNFDARARGIGVTRQQWQVLTMLRRNEGVNQGRLAELLEVEPISVCRMVDRLQEAELVERRADPADRRSWRLYLTAKAEDLLAELRPMAEAMVDDMLEGLAEAEREALRDGLERIRGNLSRRTGEPAVSHG
jgi:DNA-binding MarR family transcriptional regulator